MALKSFTFGCGQGATKAMIHCINEGILKKNDCCVVNSTIKDIPLEYQNRAIVISDDPNAGCGKVRGAAKRLMLSYIKNNPNVIDQLIEDDVDYVNIMATTEGASGSGASVILAQYIRQQIDIPVIITLITGFESDTRGLQNTIEYFKDIEGDFIVNTISNKRFIDGGNNNIFVAEKRANGVIGDMFRIVNMEDIVDSDQNIDDTDHYKVITNPGMIFITSSPISCRIKNSSQFDQIVSEAIDINASLDFIPSATKIGIYLNISDENLNCIDTTFSIIKKKLCANDCVPELFIHRQYDRTKPEFIRIIASGMNMPKRELEDMYSKLQNSKSSVSNNDDFFAKLSEMNTDIDESNNPGYFKDRGRFFEQFSVDSETSTPEESVVLGRNRRRHRELSNDNTSSNEKKKAGFKVSSSSQKQSVVYSEDSMIDKF